MSESGSFIEDDNPEQLTIQSIDAIKLMADVEEDVRKHFVNQVKELEEDLRKKQEVIEQLSTKYVETVKTNMKTNFILASLTLRRKLKLNSSQQNLTGVRASQRKREQRQR